MPIPIKPVHTLENHDEIFNYAGDDMTGLSALQQTFLGGNKREAAKYSERTIEMLRSIDQNKDELLTTAQSLATRKSSETLYTVPNTITDSALLGLKAEGLIEGRGRTVALTEKAKVALRDAYLTSKNHLKSNRTKDKFDYRSAFSDEELENTRTASTNKFKRISSEENE